MFDLLLFLLGMVPWPVWAVLALCLVCAVQFLWGWKATIAAVISLLPILGYFWGRRRQTEIDQARRDRDALRHVETRREVEYEIDDLGSQDVDERLKRWNRNED